MLVVACAGCGQKIGKLSDSPSNQHLSCFLVDAATILFRQTSKSSQILKGVCSNCKVTILYKQIAGDSDQPQLDLISNRFKTLPSTETPSLEAENAQLTGNIPKKSSNNSNPPQPQHLLENMQGNWEFRSAVQESFTRKLSLLEARLTKAHSLLQKLLHSGVRTDL